MENIINKVGEIPAGVDLDTYWHDYCYEWLSRQTLDYNIKYMKILESKCNYGRVPRMRELMSLPPTVCLDALEEVLSG